MLTTRSSSPSPRGSPGSFVTGLRSAMHLAVRRIRAAAGGTAVILTYHRVTDAPFDPHQLAIPPTRFAEHVAEFARRYEMLSVGDVVRALSAGNRLPRRGLAISFDDGYADVLESAHPILSAAGVPAILFVSTCCLSGEREFWWDELEQLVLFAPLPEKLQLSAADGGKREVPIPTEERDAPGNALERFTGWDVTQPAATVRQRLYAELSEQMRPQPPAMRARILETLRSQIGLQPSMREGKRTLDAVGVRRLVADGLVEIGAHTVNHAWLASLSPAEQRAEIAESKRLLEGILGSKVTSFSYPYGSPDSFSAETERIVRDAGFLGAVTTGLGTPPWGAAGLGSDRFALSRMPTADVPASDLVAQIDRRLGL